ncbi:MAG: ECF transporter S component, partial [Muribaculaceae bacterium]|nr:ECF transporter S component [Muribaculaceae bacterium]
MKSTTSSVALYQLSYNQLKTYLVAALFIVGNIALPQLCHLMPQGGLIFLPIYFFTLVAAYKYGFTVGLTTAVLSPLVNSALFGMPPAAALPIILIKSVTLAVVAALIAKKTNKVTLLTVALAVIVYQLIGSLAEWAMTGSIDKASQDII